MKEFLDNLNSKIIKIFNNFGKIKAIKDNIIERS